MIDPEAVTRLVEESDENNGPRTTQFADGMGVPLAWVPLMVQVQSDQMVLMFLCKLLVNRASWQPTYSVAGQSEWRWGSAVLEGETPVLRALASLVRGRMSLEIRHGDDLLCEAEPFGPNSYLVFLGDDKPQQAMTRIEFIIWAAGIVQLSLMEADLDFDAEQVAAEHGTS